MSRGKVDHLLLPRLTKVGPYTLVVAGKEYLSSSNLRATRSIHFECSLLILPKDRSLKVGNGS